MQLLDELQQLVAALNRAGIEYVVFGGVAMAILGRPRMTVDLDLLVAAEQMSAAIRVAEGVGFSDHFGGVITPPSPWSKSALSVE